MAISKVQVFEICDRLFADGQQPTLIKIRAELGSGSFSTIGGFLVEWKTASRSGSDVQLTDVPEEVSVLFENPLRVLWGKALEAAKVDSDLLVEAALADVVKAKLELDESIELADALQLETDKLMKSAMLRESRIEELNQTIEQLNLRCAEAAATEKEFRKMHIQVVSALKVGPVAKKAQK